MDNYIGETACRIEERNIDRNKRKKKNHNFLDTHLKWNTNNYGTKILK